MIMETKLNIKKTILEISFQDFYFHFINYHFYFLFIILLFFSKFSRTETIPTVCPAWVHMGCASLDNYLLGGSKNTVCFEFRVETLEVQQHRYIASIFARPCNG